MPHSISIDPRFFHNAVRDYANPVWAWVREALQNAMDSDGCNRIDITCRVGDSVKDEAGRSKETVDLTVRDNGAGMDWNTLEKRLLALGGSGKVFGAGKVGGFGKAKEILFFAQQRYSIRTQEWLVTGRGGTYDISKKSMQPGCTIQALWDQGGNVADFCAKFKEFVSLSAWKGHVYLNGELLSERTSDGSLRRELPFGKVYVTRRMSQKLVCRVSGVPMFTTWVDHKLGVVVELKNSSDFLTANRDGLCYPFSGQLQAFLNELCVDKRSALRRPVTTYQRYKVQGGKKISIKFNKPVALHSVAEQVAALSGQPTEYAVTVAALEQLRSNIQIGPAATVEADKSLAAKPKHQLEYDFVIKNNAGLKLPQAYKPETFGKYQRRLLSNWIESLIRVHTILQREDEFSVGFLFDEERLAEHEFSDDHGRIYYINPTVIIDRGATRRRKLRPRFSRTDGPSIMAKAVHEVVHGMGFKLHDEDYANKLTWAFEQVMAAKRARLGSSGPRQSSVSRFAPTGRIALTSSKHAYRGNRARLFELIKDGMTVAEFEAAVDALGLRGAKRCIARAIGHGLITVREESK